ncbi:hypothetical protein BC826DRAFT_547535 [Russula brevipes]|nr:hypothetical protein BC826DRAFT_547535 [Russula brevipes]
MAPASSSSRSHQPYQYLDALLAVIPHDSIPQGITSSSRGTHASSRPYPKFIDTALRLASGGPARPDDAPPLRDAWPELQASVRRALHALHPSTSTAATTTTTSHLALQLPATKRKLSLSSSPATTSKKPKRDDADAAAADDDAPQLTLHALSATVPVRHKIDITLHARTLRIAHSTTGAPVARCARTALRRAFLLPTRARLSGALQCTALLLAGDKPTPIAMWGAEQRFELACLVADSSSSGSTAAAPRMTVHEAPSSASAHPSAPPTPTSAREALHALLSSALAGTPVSLTTVERGAPLAGISAYRGVYETWLWFLDGDRTGTGAGILSAGQPAEFWALEDLAPGEAGVRVPSRRMVALVRRSGDGEEEEEEEYWKETEFHLIPENEMKGIQEWVQRHRGAFGIAAKVQQDEVRATAGAAADGGDIGAGGGDDDDGDSDSDSDFVESTESDGGSPSSSSGSDAGSDKDEARSEGERDAGGDDDYDGDEDEDEGAKVELNLKHHLDGNSDSDLDSDFVENAESDGGSPSSSSGSDAGSGKDEARSEGESDAGDDDDDDNDNDDNDEDEDEELNPKHHSAPLLRAGALPKMSHAAMDAAVGLVVEDRQQRRGPPGPPVVARDEESHEDEEGDEEEEDELDDWA